MGIQGTKTGPNVELTVSSRRLSRYGLRGTKMHAGNNWLVKPLRQRGGTLPISKGLTWKIHTRGVTNGSTLLLLTLGA